MNGARMARPHNAYHRGKKALVGHHQVQPAWRPNVAQARAAAELQQQQGSRIFLSQLPPDVTEQEVEELFRKTVGPVKESFLVYNSQGKSKGMAVVSFMRAGDAVLARTKYNGKIVDGRRPIKIEIIADGVPAPTSYPGAPGQAAAAAPSLMDRLGIPKPPPAAPSLVQRTQVPPTKGPAPNQPLVHKLQAKAAAAIASGQGAPPATQPRRVTAKKGPKRLKKRPLTAADLDKEMDDYRASGVGDDTPMS